MSTAFDRGWGDPTQGNYAGTNAVPCTAAGISIRVHRAVEPVFRLVLTLLGEHYELSKTADDYGGVVRPIRGREKQWAATHDFRYLSNHSWYLAGDLDSGANPMTTDRTAHHEFTASVADPILAIFGGRLVWGGNYVGERLDFMHWEYIGTPEQAKADSLLALHLLEQRTHPDVTPASLQEDLMPVIAITDSGKHWLTDLLTVKKPITGTEEARLLKGGIRKIGVSDELLADVETRG